MAATVSSIMIPRPPPSCSSLRIGGGLEMSKIRNNTNPVSNVCQLMGTKAYTNGNAAISSHTMLPGSFCPRNRAARSHNGTPTRNMIRPIPSRPHMGTPWPSSQPRGRPHRLPNVPGITGIRPKPKPSATNKTPRSITFIGSGDGCSGTVDTSILDSQNSNRADGLLNGNRPDVNHNRSQETDACRKK